MNIYNQIHDLNGTQQVVACGASVYKQAKEALENV